MKAAAGHRGQRARRLLLGAALATPFVRVAQAAIDCGPAGSGATEQCVAGVPVRRIGPMQQRQEASEWCWAASVSMILRHYGSCVSQEQVVRAALGGRVENRPLTDRAIVQLLNRRWEEGDGSILLLRAAPQPTWREASGLVAPEVLADLGEGRPVLVLDQAHVMVLVQLVFERLAGGGVRPRRAVVLDPAHPAGLRSLHASEMVPDRVVRVSARRFATPQAGAEAVPAAERVPARCTARDAMRADG